MAGPLTQTDPSFLNDLRRSADSLTSNPLRHLATLLAPSLVAATDRASQVSRKQFPGQDWDNTQRNALRHSMWVGGMAQALGAGPDSSPYLTGLASSSAKGIGYANELISYLAKYPSGEVDNPEYISDTLHDLNNNAVGTRNAAEATSPEDLQRRLIYAAMNARQGQPAGLLDPTDGQLSFDPGTPTTRGPTPR